ncbi:hypothetical protein PRZ48_007737 [Zasmidium cellare]|uniref:DUF7587 domain-containing protein n=1 Tax=Zasmidium cellare TaxID=395010 RepID=A0ABR0EKC1_ZASCE|nr:hypothetical protein PRZ48_007737 [Zasmidium cellare]
MSRARVLYPRPDDKRRNLKPLELTDEQHQLANEELVPVDEARAHPPLAPIFYRYWSELEEDSNYNSRTGNKAPSPFISVSDAFWWSLGQTLKIASGNGKTATKYPQDYRQHLRISIIDSTALNPRGVYHLTPYQTELRKKFPFHNGTHRYRNDTEFLVWQEALRNRALEQQNIQLDDTITSAIAKLASVFGIGLEATAEQISHFVDDIIKSFAIQMPHCTSQEWARLASVFETTMVTDTDRLVLLTDHEIKRASVYRIDIQYKHANRFQGS